MTIYDTELFHDSDLSFIKLKKLNQQHTLIDGTILSRIKMIIYGKAMTLVNCRPFVERNKLFRCAVASL